MLGSERDRKVAKKVKIKRPNVSWAFNISVRMEYSYLFKTIFFVMILS